MMKHSMSTRRRARPICSSTRSAKTPMSPMTSMRDDEDTGVPWGAAGLSVAALLLTQHEKVEALDLLARPRRAPEELQARGDAGIRREAADVHLPAELWPTIVRHQLVQNLLERDAVKRVVPLGAHCLLGGAGHGDYRNEG